MKRMLALVLAMVMAFSISACGGTDGSSGGTESSSGSAAAAQTAGDGEKFVAYFVGVMAGGSVWGQAQAGFEAACAELGRILCLSKPCQ